MPGPSTSRQRTSKAATSTKQRGGASRGGHGKLTVTGVRKGKKALGPEATKHLSRQLRDTIEQEERRQLAAWLDAKHKQLDNDLKKLGVGVNPAPRPTKGTVDDTLQVLSRRLKRYDRRKPQDQKQQGQEGESPPHIHRTVYVTDTDEETTGDRSR